MSKSQVGCLLLILLSVSAFHDVVLGARNLREKVEDKEKTQDGKESSKIEDRRPNCGYMDRCVPSCPDPIHNRKKVKRSMILAKIHKVSYGTQSRVGTLWF
ncbi:unnamed protein product [Dovyalis caffra]|uniref:Uncharacterized protein n=1 Tax=Dovyalis caffra TaxID=77055 RepID=A0AAV1RYY7_9ROSI|nr:unnamed protein product [Dovyalis caffra]